MLFYSLYARLEESVVVSSIIDSSRGEGLRVDLIL